MTWLPLLGLAALVVEELCPECSKLQPQKVGIDQTRYKQSAGTWKGGFLANVSRIRMDWIFSHYTNL